MELCARLARIPRIGVLPSDGNFVLIDISATGMTAPQVVDAMLSEGVLIRSLEVHHATRHFVRVTVGTAVQNARCADALERVLRRGPVRDIGKPFLSVSAVGGDAE
jgi:histidinol-phosphate/aromatic aminotransferase/cobyric acid decarboxylase-like protein